MGATRDFELGYECRFGPLAAPPDARQRGAVQSGATQLIRCHHRIRADLPVVDLELHSRLGSSVLERLTLRPADRSWPEQSFALDVSIAPLAWIAVEAIDVDGDGTEDLVIPAPCSRPDCEAVHQLVFRPAAHRAGQAPFEHRRLPSLVEREDIALGNKCEFFTARQLSPTPRSGPVMDPDWERRKGRRVVSCHFELAAGLPVFDVETTTEPGIGMVDRVVIRPADGCCAASFDKLGHGVGLSDWTWIEAEDVDFDGVRDLVMPRARGTMPCNLFRYFVFDRAKHEAHGPAFVSSDVEDLCNPRVDAKRKLVIGDDVQAGGSKQLRWRGERFEVVGEEP